MLLSFFIIGPSHAQDFTASAMAPLYQGSLHSPPRNKAEAEALYKYKHELYELKRLGATSISFDVWWGKVAKLITTPSGKKIWTYDWSDYETLFALIVEAGLKPAPMLSFHRCGGNVGDDITILLPEGIWTKHIGEPGVTDENSLKFKSEQGNFSDEFFAPSAIPIVLKDLMDFVGAFQFHFAAYAEFLENITLSLGPAGELREPSFNSHDRGAGYPTRGSLQLYNELDIKAFQRAMLKKYGSLDQIKNAWGPNFEPITSIDQIGPPNFNTTSDYYLKEHQPKAKFFFESDEVHTPYGKDVFEFSNQSLLKGAALIVKSTAKKLNSPRAAFKKIPIAIKVAGIHWQAGNSRYAELAAGVISVPEIPTPPDQLGNAYRPLLKVFQNISTSKNSPPIEIHFTCIELSDGASNCKTGSLAQSLVKSFIQEAKKMNLTVKGENALEHKLLEPKSWDNMEFAISSGLSGINLLRGRSIIAHEMTRNRFKSITKKYCNSLLKEAQH